jgi:protein SCO1
MKSMPRHVPPFAFALLAIVLTACAQGKSAPDFTLTNDGGQPWTLSAQRGRLVLMTFGFTHCSDTCPATLAKLARLVETFGPQTREAEIAFVTVDPQRDTPSVMHAFVKRFSSDRIVGLTGTAAQIASVENAYHVWAQKVPGPAHGSGKRANAYQYDEVHSAVIYFIDRNGAIRALRDDDDSQAVLGQTIHEIAG